MSKYIVGIDYGHGETAAWVVPDSTAGDTNMKPEGMPLRLRQSNDAESQKIPSVVYYDKAGNYSLTSFSQCGIITGMKGLIATMDEERKGHYARYIRLIVEKLLELNGDILKMDDGSGAPNFRLCIASPTKWNEDEKKEYLDFFNDAISPLGLRFDWIINESDAAYFTHSSNGALDDKCTLVIDYGSSTIDYTAMKNGRKISSDKWSNKQIGASIIERTMMDTLSVADGVAPQEMLAGTKALLLAHGFDHIDPAQCLLFELRKLKETTYTDGTRDFELNFKFTSKTGLKEFAKPIYEFMGDIREVTTDYREIVRQNLTDLRGKLREVNGGADPERVILSGGASIMRWFKEMVRDIFFCDNVEDRMPGFVVAKGVALYARAQEHAVKDLVNKIRAVDYGKMYKDADSQASTKGVKQFEDMPVRKVIDSAPLTGNDIRKIFCDFVRDLNSQNHSYCDLVQKSLDSYLCSKVAEELKSVIRSIFHVSVELHDISIHVPVVVLDWDDRNFEEGGGWYDFFTKAIKGASSRLFFSWDVPRDKNEAKSIAEGVKKRLSAFDFAGEINYSTERLNEIGSEIREKAEKYAIELFFDNQLFKTTFAD